MRIKTLITTLALLLVALVFAPAATSATSATPAWTPGCPPARHVTFFGPWDGGDWFFPRWSSKPLRLAIVHVWANLDAVSVRDNPRNPGQPAWGQTLIKVKVTPKILKRMGAKKVRFFGLGGEAWIYDWRIKSCRDPEFINDEFANGNLPKRTLARLADDGYARPY